VKNDFYNFARRSERSNLTVRRRGFHTRAIFFSTTNQTRITQTHKGCIGVGGDRQAEMGKAEGECSSQPEAWKRVRATLPEYDPASYRSRSAFDGSQCIPLFSFFFSGVESRHATNGISKRRKGAQGGLASSRRVGYLSSPPGKRSPARSQQSNCFGVTCHSRSSARPEEKPFSLPESSSLAMVTKGVCSLPSSGRVSL
jgi:hypothetical protein